MRISGKNIFAMFALPLFTVAFFALIPYDIDAVYVENLVVNYISALSVVVLLLIYGHSRKTGIFDPIYFFSVIYLFMFFIAPIYDILMGKYYWFGYDLFKYGLKATLIELAGYIAFYFAYTVSFREKESLEENIKEIEKEKFLTEDLSPAKRHNIVLVVLLMYLVCFAANVFYLVGSYKVDLLYLLTLGIVGDTGVTDETVENIGFVSMLSYSLPTVTMLYWEYGRSKTLKIVLFIPMLMLQVSRGFRFLVIQIFVTFIAYYFISKQKKVKFLPTLFIILVMILFLLLMTLFRDAVRMGVGADLSYLSADILRDAFDAMFWENLRIYRNFYGMVDAIPSRYDYVYGRQIIIGTIVMVVPRIIWPGKIPSYGGVSLVEIIGSNLNGTGQAYPTIGEYYYALGIVGVIMFMVFFALWLKYLRKHYFKSRDPLKIIAFSSMLGCILQLLIRGYFPSNFWYLVFCLIPVWIIRKMRDN